MEMARGDQQALEKSVDRGADILLVEDDPADGEFALRALQHCGFGQRVAHVSDGIEALDYIYGTGIFARSRPASLPKLILLDLGLKKLGGLQVLRQLKADERTRGIPIVVLTGSITTIELAESYKLGVNSYVIKPTDGQKFSAMVAKIGHYWLEINETAPV
jgi:CheY-like chemotaxis protein